MTIAELRAAIANLPDDFEVTVELSNDLDTSRMVQAFGVIEVSGAYRCVAIRTSPNEVSGAYRCVAIRTSPKGQRP